MMMQRTVTHDENVYDVVILEDDDDIMDEIKEEDEEMDIKPSK